jgi:hypothetical protein
MAGIIQTNELETFPAGIKVKGREIAECLPWGPVSRVRHARHRAGQNPGDHLVTDHDDGLSIGMSGEDLSEGPDSALAYVCHAFAARYLDSKRVAAPLQVLVRPSSRHFRVGLAGPLAIVHARQAWQGLDLQSMRIGDDSRRMGRSLQWTRVDRGRRNLCEPGSRHSGLGNTFCAEWEIDDPTEAPFRRIAIWRSGSNVPAGATMAH